MISKAMSSKREISLDFARAISMLWVVGFWHLVGSYDEKLSLTSLGWADNITTIAMSVFFFISGLFMGQKKYETKNDIRSFYKSRLTRFYFLFVISVVTMYVGGLVMPHQMISSTRQLFLTLLGVTTFFPPQAGQFWFISMLIIFYALTPVVMHWKKKWKQVGSVLCLMGLFAAWNSFHAMDNRIYMYFSVYSVAMLFGRYIHCQLKESKLLSLILLGGVSACMIVVFEAKSIRVNGLPLWVMIFAGTFFIVAFSEFVSECFLKRSKHLLWMVSSMAYLSMAAYLFHRQCFSASKALMNHLFGWDVDYWMMYAVMLPFTLIVSYAIQYIYDYFVKRFSKS